MSGNPDHLNGSARIANVEIAVRDVRDDIRRLHEKIDTLTTNLARQQAANQVDEAKLAAELVNIKSKTCPSPGSCVKLEERVGHLETEWTRLHNAKQQVIGGAKVVRMLWIGLGAVLTAAFYAFRERLGL